MNLIRLFAFLVALALSAAPVFGQDSSVFEVTQLADHIYKLTADGGGYDVKVVASVGPDGILIVDAALQDMSTDLKEALQELGGGLPDVIISTHAHVEHTEGNKFFGKEAVIFGHANLRKTLRSGSFLFDEFPDDALPEITFTDSLSIYFNGEEIKLIAFPGAHDNSDIIVWFTGSKVVCVGALSNGRHFPSVDARGDVLKYPEIAGNVIDILPEDVKIIPGHGEDGTMEDFRAFHDMLVQTTEMVRAALDQGKDLETMQSEDILKGWESFEISYVGKNDWISYLVNGFEKPPVKKSIYEPIYAALKDKGSDAAIQVYLDLKNNNADEYNVDDVYLFIIPYKLVNNKKYDEAIRFFELYNREYPDGEYNWLSYGKMGIAYHEMGDDEKAVVSLKKSLELNPENSRTAELLDEIEGG